MLFKNKIKFYYNVVLIINICFVLVNFNLNVGRVGKFICNLWYIIFILIYVLNDILCIKIEVYKINR